jgi:hypothetical protein
LHAWGEQMHDLLVNLFKGYKACKNSEFVEYIKKKEDMHEERGNIEKGSRQFGVTGPLRRRPS